MDEILVGDKLKEVRTALGYSTHIAAKRSEGTVSPSQISKLERNVQNINNTSWGVICGLARAYHMNPIELLDTVQGRGSLEPVKRLTETINVYKLSQANLQGHKEIMGKTEIDASLPGIYEGYIITGEQLAGLIPQDCIAKVRRQNTASSNDLIILYHPETGVILRRYLGERVGVTTLATGTYTETLSNITIIGKVVSYEVQLEDLPNR